MHPGGEDSLRDLWVSISGFSTRAMDIWKELEEVLVGVEVTLSNRPLCYVDDDVQLLVLTPSATMFGQVPTLSQTKT